MWLYLKNKDNGLSWKTNTKRCGFRGIELHLANNYKLCVDKIFSLNYCILRDFLKSANNSFHWSTWSNLACTMYKPIQTLGLTILNLNVQRILKFNIENRTLYPLVFAEVLSNPKSSSEQNDKNYSDWNRYYVIKFETYVLFWMNCIYIFHLYCLISVYYIIMWEFHFEKNFLFVARDISTNWPLGKDNMKFNLPRIPRKTNEIKSMTGQTWYVVLLWLHNKCNHWVKGALTRYSSRISFWKKAACIGSFPNSKFLSTSRFQNLILAGLWGKYHSLSPTWKPSGNPLWASLERSLVERSPTITKELHSDYQKNSEHSTNTDYWSDSVVRWPRGFHTSTMNYSRSFTLATH